MNCKKDDMAYVSVPPSEDIYELNGHIFKCVRLFCNHRTGKPMWEIEPYAMVNCPKCGERHGIEGIADSALRPMRPPPLEDEPPPVEINEPREVFA